MTLCRVGLVERCCKVISRNREMYDIEKLEKVIPDELYSICLELKTEKTKLPMND